MTDFLGKSDPEKVYKMRDQHGEKKTVSEFVLFRPRDKRVNSALQQFELAGHRGGGGERGFRDAGLGCKNHG